jgi:hypothetical protein
MPVDQASPNPPIPPTPQTPDSVPPNAPKPDPSPPAAGIHPAPKDKPADVAAALAQLQEGAAVSAERADLTQLLRDGPWDKNCFKATLRGWLKSIVTLQYLHFKAANHYTALQIKVGIPTLIASAVATAIAGTALKDVPYLLVAFTTLTTCLTSAQTFLGWDARAKEHHQTAQKYGLLRSRIERYRCLQDASNPVMNAILFETVKDMDEVTARAQKLPDSLWRNRQKYISDELLDKILDSTCKPV